LWVFFRCARVLIHVGQQKREEGIVIRFRGKVREEEIEQKKERREKKSGLVPRPTLFFNFQFALTQKCTLSTQT